MKILHLSTYDIAGGGAIAAYRLHRGLIDSGIESRMLVQNRSSQDPTVEALPSLPIQSLTHRLLRERWARVLREHRQRDGLPDGMISDSDAPYRPNDFKAIDDADLVHLHWTTGMLDWPTVLPWLASRKPLVWTLHDMNPFLGTQHYRDPAETLPTAFARWDQRVFARKRKLLDTIPRNRLHFVAPSRWIKGVAEQSVSMSGREIHHIPNGIAEDSFRALEQRAVVRKSLGIPEDRLVIGFVAQSMAEPRKGMSQLLDVLGQKELSESRSILLCAGGNPLSSSTLPTIYLGSIQSERLMNLFYNALDLFVCPSLADNLPNTVMEAMACGVPTIAFAVGGIPEMVRPGISGWIADRPGDVASLSEAMRSAMRELSSGGDYRKRCQVFIQSEYSLSRQVASMAQLYRSLIG